MIDDQKFAWSFARIDLQPELPERALIRVEHRVLGVDRWGRARLLGNEGGELKIEIKSSTDSCLVDEQLAIEGDPRERITKVGHGRAMQVKFLVAGIGVPTPQAHAFLGRHSDCIIGPSITVPPWLVSALASISNRSE